MGDVWEASNTATGRAVAIKRLRHSHADTSGVGRARFVREAQTACAVDHPNVVEVLDFVDSVDEPPILVMELLRGETLAARLEAGLPLSPEETARLLLPVVSAVGTAHARGIVHRDLKPANIFLEQSGDEVRVKVLDFGIAKWMSAAPSDGALLTETGSTLGTPCYMAPEQALGERVIDHRADVWALGVILYECLSGTRPVEGENAARIVVRLLRTGIMPLERLVPSLPPELTTLVTNMLARDASQRPASPAFGDPDVPLAPRSSELGLSSAATVPALATSLQVPATAPRRLLAVGLGVLALVAVAALWLSRAASPGARRASAAAVTPSARVVTTRPVEPPTPATRVVAVAVPTQEASAASASVSSTGLARNAAPPHRAASKPVHLALAAGVPSATGRPSAGLPAGAACERSRDCASKLCLAMSCR
jgi:hypothetical protein